MKYSKQRLATAMAATMVVSMVPAMAFAAPADLNKVVDELGKEDTAKAKTGDVTSAEAVLAVAKTFVNGDVQAQLLVDAYQASIDVLKATSKEDFAAKKAVFDAAVAKLTFLDVSGSFKSVQTMDNHNKIGKKFEAPAADATASYTSKSILGVTLVEISLKDATAADVTKVLINGAGVEFKPDKDDANMVTANFDDAITKLEVEVKGKLVEASKK